MKGEKTTVDGGARLLTNISDFVWWVLRLTVALTDYFVNLHRKVGKSYFHSSSKANISPS